MSKKPNNHIHRYKKHVYSTGTKIFFCTNGACSHKIEISLSLGKPCLCNVCQKEFNLDEYAIRLTRPRCKNCRKHKGDVIESNITPDSVSSLMEKLRKTIGRDSGNVLDEVEMVSTRDEDIL